MAGVLLNFDAVHTRNIVVAVVAAAGNKHGATPLTAVVCAHHRSGQAASLVNVVEEVALWTLGPHGINVGNGAEVGAIEVAAASGTVRLEARNRFAFGTANILLGMRCAFHLTFKRTAADLYIKVLR